MSFQTWSDIGLIPDALYQLANFDRNNPQSIANEGSNSNYGTGIFTINDNGSRNRPNGYSSVNNGRGILLSQNDRFDVATTDIQGTEYTLIVQFSQLKPAIIGGDFFGIEKGNGDFIKVVSNVPQQYRLNRNTGGSIIAQFNLDNGSDRYQSATSNNLNMIAIQRNGAQQMLANINGVQFGPSGTDTNNYSIDGQFFIAGVEPVVVMSLAFFDQLLTSENIESIFNNRIGTYGV